MKTLLGTLGLLLIAGAGCCANAIGPVVLGPMDDPRIARFAARHDGAAPELVTRAKQVLRAKGLLPHGSTWHPADMSNSPTAGNSWFGFSMAASADYLVVGAPGMDPGTGAHTGRAYLFRRFGPDLILVATLAASDPAGEDWFGYTVAIDGDTVMVSAVRDDIGAGTEVGSVYVFERDGESWPQVAKLYPADTMSNSHFGHGLHLEGDRAMVGAIGACAPMFSGCIFNYQRVDGTWTVQSTMVPPDPQNAQWFGVDIARDGDTLVVGAPMYDGFGPNTGRVVVYQRDGGPWMPVGDLQDPASQGVEWFGADVAISGDVVAVGAAERSIFGMPQAGAVLIFEAQNGVWSPFPVTTLSAGAVSQSDFFGQALALDGNTLWVTMAAVNRPPVLYTYRKEDAQWLPAGQYTPPPPPGFFDGFGSDLALTADALFVSARSAQGQTTNLPEVGRVDGFQRTALITPQAGAGGQLLPPGPQQRLAGHPVFFFVQPDPGYRIVSVSGCEGQLTGQNYMFTARNDCTVSASFANSTPQASGISAEPGGYEGEPFNVTLTATDTESYPLSYSFDCDGDGSFELGPQASHVGACVVTHAGSYTAVARVTDLGGLSASLTATVTLQNSQPSVSVSAPASVNEDAVFMVTTTASVPSSGEQIVAVDVDCDFDGVNFNADVSAAAPGNLQCPAYASGGGRTIAARATDNEGDRSTSTTTLSVTAVNDPPTFTLAGNQQHGPGATGSISIPQFVSNISVGPADEQGQQITQMHVIVQSNPNGVLATVNLAQNGTLSYTLSGNGGTATLSVILIDDGGEPGQPVSDPVHFTITNLPGTDLQISIDDGRSAVMSGDSTLYEVLVGNAGPNQANARINMPLPVGASEMTWTCIHLPGAICPAPATGTGPIDHNVVLAVDGVARFLVSMNISTAAGGFSNATATISATDNNGEVDSSDNSATDTNAVVGIGIFSNSFEQASGTLRMLGVD